MIEVGILRREMTLDVRADPVASQEPLREGGRRSESERRREASRGRSREDAVASSGRRGHEPERGGRQPGKGAGASAPQEEAAPLTP